MSVDFGTLAQALISPYLWFIYEAMGIFVYWMFSFFRKWGKDLHVIGDIDPGGVFHELGHKYVDPLEQKFRTRSGKGFATERRKFGYVQSAIGGDRRVIFHLLSKARPRDTEMKSGKDGEAIGFRVKPSLPDEKSIDGRGKSKATEAEDPTSEDFGHMVAGEVKDQVAAGSTGSANYGKLMLALMLIVGVMVGAFVILLYMTHGFTANPSTTQIPCLPPAHIFNINGTVSCQ